MRKLFIRFINLLPYVKKLQKEISKYNIDFFVKPGHYYSPLISTEEIKRRQNEIWHDCDIEIIPDVELNTKEQLALVEELTEYYKEMPFTIVKQKKLRYYFDNIDYCQSDAILLYSIIRHLKPNNIIEVGCGFSSAVMIDTKELFHLENLKLTFIEPYPDRLNSLIRTSDKLNNTFIAEKLQSVNLSVFKCLSENDILFIDSTHVAKTGSDVNYLFFKIFPVLQKGVLIHFHDIFFPFEYPIEWVLENRGWNETYLLRAFLMNNESYKIILFTEYLHKFHPEVFAKMPKTYIDHGGSIWLRKQ